MVVGQTAAARTAKERVNDGARPRAPRRQPRGRLRHPPIRIVPSRAPRRAAPRTVRRARELTDVSDDARRARFRNQHLTRTGWHRTRDGAVAPRRRGRAAVARARRPNARRLLAKPRRSRRAARARDARGGRLGRAPVPGRLLDVATATGALQRRRRVVGAGPSRRRAVRVRRRRGVRASARGRPDRGGRRRRVRRRRAASMDARGGATADDRDRFRSFRARCILSLYLS